MYPILRNLISVVRRFKLAAALNILGLSVAFAAFMVIMIQLNYDFGFDKFHKDHDKIFRMEIVHENSASISICRPLAELFFESSPHIIAGAITNPFDNWFSFYNENDKARKSYRERYFVVSPSFFDVFSFDFVEGSQEDRLAPYSVFIPLSLSRKLFGNEPAVGKRISGPWGGYETVKAVYRDFPENSMIKNRAYFAMQPNENKDNWQNYNYNAYFRVNEASNLSLIYENFKQNFDANFESWEQGIKLRFTVLPDIHFVADVESDQAPKASLPMLMILFAIAIALIVIAVINFTNFNTALTPMRVRNINTQRVFGAQKNAIRWAILFEAVFFCAFSYLVALLLILFFKNTPLANFVDVDLSFANNSLIVAATAVFALLTGLITGFYPSRYMTSFETALVLNGNFGLSPKGKQLRNTLIGIQFVASLSMIIGTSFMYLQNHFMQNSPLGYNKDALITVNAGGLGNMRDVFTNKLKSHSGIEDVTYGEFLISNSSDVYMGWGCPYKGEQISFKCLPVHHTFLKVMGFEITEGRDFRQDDAGTENGVFVFNETARKKFNLEIGSTVCAIRGEGEI
jgi:putative ABC transport system permease protein